MEIRSQTNTFEGGMDMDTDVSYISNNTYRYAENVRLVTDTNGTNGILQNIQYIKEYLTVDQLSDQTILYAIAAQIPDENDQLQNSAIVLTYDNNNKTHNHLYIINNFNSQKLSCKCILKILWKLSEDDDITMVYNYETSNVYKLYINSFSKGLNIINLHEFTEEWGDKPIEEDANKFNTKANVLLPPLEFKQFTDGSLLAGTYQYYYKLYNDSGIITTVSSGSQLIPNAIDSTKTDNAYCYSGGYTEDYLTNNGIQLSVTLNNSSYTRYQTFRVRWKNNNDLPSIELFSEGKISQGNNVTLTISDTNNNVITTVSQEEFNDIIPFLFNARIMYQYQNRLFFSNITSNSWDIPESYDCRAYRANKSGNVLLTNSTGTQEYSGSLSDILNGTAIIDKEADAINPMNKKLIYPNQSESDEYAYNASGNYGGDGINIGYDIVYAITQEGYWSYDNTVEGKSAFGVSANGPKGVNPGDIISNNIDIYRLGSNEKIDSISLEQEQIISFYNPTVSAKLASYQRDETYRFGIVFYNENSVASPVHWIGDVRFPSGDTAGCEAFSTDNANGRDLISKPLGIRFNIKNFPEGAVSAEIVRCDRTSSDRSIRSQGMLNTTVHFYDSSFTTNASNYNPETSLGENDIRAQFIPAINGNAQTDAYVSNVDFHWSGGDESLKWRLNHEVKTFASPEICMNPDAENISSGDYVVPIYVARSIINDSTRTPSADTGYFNSYATYRPSDSPGSLIKHLISVQNDRLFVRSRDAESRLIIMKYYNFTAASEFLKNALDTWTSSVPGVDKTTENGKYFTWVVDQYRTARRDLPFQGFTNRDEAYKSYKQNYVDIIEGKSYTNLAVAANTMGVAGINGLIGFQDIIRDNILYNAYDDRGGMPEEYDYPPITLICNIKRIVNPYGGNTYYNRAANVYISCGSYIKAGQSSVITYGGDTYLTKFCYQHAGMIAANDWENMVSYCTNSVFVNLPVESTINTYFRSDDVPTKLFDRNNFDAQYYHTQVGTINSVSQTIQMYQYNSAYSVSSSGTNYAAKSTNDNISNTENNRYQIVCSEAKSAGEILDSWAVSKFANTLDMDSKYGQVTRLIDFRDRLYVLQQNALSVLSVNERSLISDNSGAALVLGQGGILDRYDVIVQNYGTNVINDRSAVSTFQSIYWYDNNKNVICSYGNNGFHILSKEKKVQTFLNEIAQLDKIDALSIINDKWNEVWMRFKGMVIIYNEQADVFTSFYTHRPDWGLRFYDRLVTIQNKKFYYTNTFGEEDIVKKLRSKLTFVVNQDPQYTKVFDNQWFSGNLEDPDNDTPQVLDNINFKTKQQDSFEINYNDIDYREDTYRFPIPRQDRGDLGSNDEQEQNVINRSYLPRMRGKYMLCHYEFNCDNDKQFEIPFIKTTYRQSML